MASYTWYKQGQALLQEMDSTHLSQGIAFWSLGQAGFLFKFQGTFLCIDPTLNDLLDEQGSTRRNYQHPFEPSQVTNWDYVICTHDHADHLNLETLVPLSLSSPETIFIVPKPCVQKLIDAGIATSRIIGATQSAEICLKNNITLMPIESCHEEYDYDADGNCEALGFILRQGDFTAYHAGDTILTERLLETMRQSQPINIAFLPINGADFERRFRNMKGNMNARDAAFFADYMQADLVVPYHFDMVMQNGENPAIFAQYMHEMYCGNKYHILMLGERFVYLP